MPMVSMNMHKYGHGFLNQTRKNMNYTSKKKNEGEKRKNTSK